MTKQLKPGYRATWKSHGGTAEGKVVRKLTSATRIKGHKVAASKNNPEYLVETEQGEQTAHNAEALTKV
jgi:Hypervirulence associated proteins TUDOR domain